MNCGCAGSAAAADEDSAASAGIALVSASGSGSIATVSGSASAAGGSGAVSSGIAAISGSLSAGAAATGAVFSSSFQATGISYSAVGIGGAGTMTDVSNAAAGLLTPKCCGAIDESEPSMSLNAAAPAMWSGTSTIGCALALADETCSTGSAAIASFSYWLSWRTLCATMGGTAILPMRSSNFFMMARRSLASNGLIITPSAFTRFASSGLYGSILPTVSSTGIFIVSREPRTFSHTSSPEYPGM